MNKKIVTFLCFLSVCFVSLTILPSVSASEAQPFELNLLRIYDRVTLRLNPKNPDIERLKAFLNEEGLLVAFVEDIQAGDSVKLLLKNNKSRELLDLTVREDLVDYARSSMTVIYPFAAISRWAVGWERVRSGDAVKLVFSNSKVINRAFFYKFSLMTREWLFKESLNEGGSQTKLLRVNPYDLEFPASGPIQR